MWSLITWVSGSTHDRIRSLVGDKSVANEREYRWGDSDLFRPLLFF